VSQLHGIIAEYVDLLIAASQQTRSLFDLSGEYCQAYADVMRRYNALYADTVQLSADFNQLEQENISLRASCGKPPSSHVGQSLFSLQHPNNVRRAQATRQQQPRQSRVDSLREPGGGLGFSARAPAPVSTQGGMQAREGRFGAVNDGRPPSSGNQQGGEEKEDSDADSGPGPTVVDEE
jgi:hypothetical protein